MELAPEGARIGDGKSVLRGVVDVKAARARECGCSLHVPVSSWSVVDGERGTQILSDSAAAADDPPCAKVFNHSARHQAVCKAAFESDVTRCVVILEVHRGEELIVCAPTGNESGFAPGPSNPEIDSAGKAARGLVNLGEWTGLANQVSGGRDRVEEGTGICVEKKAKEVLIQL